MNLKKIKVIATICIFIISFLSHFAYNLFPNIIFSFFFPVNESIWEHMKILFTSTLIYGIVDYYLLKKNNIKFNNFSFQLYFTALLVKQWRRALFDIDIKYLEKMLLFP